MADSQLFVVNCNYDPDSELFVLDKTAQEILDASTAGKIVLIRQPDLYDGYGTCDAFIAAHIACDTTVEYTDYLLYIVGVKYHHYSYDVDIDNARFAVDGYGSLSDYPIRLDS